jgi:diaminopropionate ammonia-lyase
MCEYLVNTFKDNRASFDAETERAFQADDVSTLHQSLPGYAPTPLVSLSALARDLGVAEITVKDESFRFNLAAFKVLGASYATWRFLAAEWQRRFRRTLLKEDLFSGAIGRMFNDLVLCTATDGNHGRAVAWTAALLGLKSVIYMPANTVPARIENIRAEGAEVKIVDGDYDAAVRHAAAEASRRGWQIIADTSYHGYTKIPRWIQAGYLTLFREVDQAITMFGLKPYDLVFIQSGVGSLAAAACWYYRRERQSAVRLVNVEPEEADCLFCSARDPEGALRSAPGSTNSMMAGLNCGTPSMIAWPLIRAGMDMFMSIPDRFSEQAMRAYYHPSAEDRRIISGESGAAGLAALMALAKEPGPENARRAVGLTKDSRVLLLNTEGATDPENFRLVVGQQP